MAVRENWRAATFNVVSTGSAAGGRSQPVLGLSAPAQRKTPGPGALIRGFLGAFVTLLTAWFLSGDLGNRGETRLEPRRRKAVYGTAAFTPMNSRFNRVAVCRSQRTTRGGALRIIDEWARADR